MNIRNRLSGEINQKVHDIKENISKQPTDQILPFVIQHCAELNTSLNTILCDEMDIFSSLNDQFKLLQ